MNSGVAKAIREKWPIVFAKYQEVFNQCATYNIPANEMLGAILSVNLAEYEPKTWPQTPIVVNMFSQEYYGYDGKRYTSYDAFWSCLGHIHESIPKGSKIAFPYKIGCDRGGANWEVIYTMIVAALGYDYNIEICYLQEDGWLKFHLDLGWEDK